jgi:hypothetical protein
VDAATLTNDGRSTTEVKTRLAIIKSAMEKFSKIWKSREISCPTEMKLFRSLVIYILLYDCRNHQESPVL